MNYLASSMDIGVLNTVYSGCWCGVVDIEDADGEGVKTGLDGDDREQKVNK